MSDNGDEMSIATKGGTDNLDIGRGWSMFGVNMKKSLDWKYRFLIWLY